MAENATQDTHKLIVSLEARIRNYEKNLKKALGETKAYGKGARAEFAKTSRQTQQGFSGISGAFAKFGQISGKQRFIIQNTANQFGDLAVQIGSGQSAVRAFGQQMPQLLGAFGAFGAILGTVAAIGIPVGAALFNMASGAKDAGEEGKTFRDRVDALESALDAYQKASENAKLSTGDLAEKYGVAAGEARSLLQQHQKLAEVQALSALSNAVQEVGRSYTDLFEAIDRADNLADKRSRARSAILGARRYAIEKLAETYELTNAQTRQFIGLLKAAEDAKGLESQTRTVKDLRQFIEDARGSVGNMNGETRTLYENLLNTEAGAAELHARLDGVPDTLARAVAQADTLSAAITNAANAAAALKQSQANQFQNSEIKLKYKNDPIGQAKALAEAQFNQKTGDTTGLDKIVQISLQQQRAEFIATAEATEMNRVALQKWQEQQRKTQKPQRARKTKKRGVNRLSPDQRFNQSVEQIERRIAVTRAMTAAQAELNPSVNDYGAAIEKARITQELLNAATQAGLSVTPQLKSRIDALADGYVAATVEARKLGISQKEAERAASENAAFRRDLVGGFVSDLRNGVSAADAFANAISKIADRIQDQLLDAIFQVNGAKSGGGGFGNMIGSFFSSAFGGGPTIAASLFHDGRTSSSDKPRGYKSLSVGQVANAPRYHTGLKPNEFAAVLENTESVLTKNEMGRTVGAMGGAASALAAKGGGYREGGGHITVGVDDEMALRAAFDRRLNQFGPQLHAQTVDEVKGSLQDWSDQLRTNGVIA